ncbi:hypothetical protein ACJJTC_012547 [Scirpophaga incertulas]
MRINVGSVVSGSADRRGGHRGCGRARRPRLEHGVHLLRGAGLETHHGPLGRRVVELTRLGPHTSRGALARGAPAAAAALGCRAHGLAPQPPSVRGYGRQGRSVVEPSRRLGKLRLR